MKLINKPLVVEKSVNVDTQDEDATKPFTRVINSEQLKEKTQTESLSGNNDNFVFQDFVHTRNKEGK